MADPDLTLVSEASLPAHLNSTLNSAKTYADTKATDAKQAAIDDSTKKYGEIPNRVVSLKEGTKLSEADHLDDKSDPGRYFQTLNTAATPERGYPIPRAGVLDVFSWGYSDGPLLIQIYWPYNYEGFFWRHVYYSSKTWKEVPTKSAIQGMIDAQLPPARSLRSSVVTIGDSLTDGYSNGAPWPNADKWPTILDGLLPTASVLEYGLAGYTTDATMIYIGALQPRFKVPGGSIPADGSAVTVNVVETYGIHYGQLAVGGTLAGINGTLTWSSSEGRWTFKSLDGKGATGLTGTYQFKATRIGTWETSTAIIWLGRNDISNATKGMEASVADHVVASTKRLVAELTPKVKQVMICGVTTRVSEEQGSNQHAWVTEINRRLRELFPEYFRSAQDYLRDHALTDLGMSPTETDSAKLAAGTIPPSVMDDDTHISKATANAMARNFFHPFLTGKGYVD